MTAGAVPAVQAVREARRSLAEARDDQVLKVVSVLDRLENRGAGDEVLAPVRGRLRTLQPPRPLRLSRLLFLPFDPLIQTPAAWRPGGPHLPRSAIACLASLAREGVKPDIAARLDYLIAGGGITAHCPGEAGELLWPHAAAALQRAIPLGPPASWAEAGLPAGEFVPILTGLIPVLIAETQLRQWGQQRWQPAQDDALAGLLRQAMPLGHRAWGMMLALLLIRFPHSPAPFEAAVTAGGQTGRPFRDAADAALSVGLAGIEDARTPVSLTASMAAAEIGRLASLAESLAARLPDAQRRERTVAARARLQQECVERFGPCIKTELTGPLLSLSAAASDAMMERAEGEARRLRQFAAEARRLGGGGHYDALLAEAAASLGAATMLNTADRARLTEILQGLHAALRVLRTKG